ncbi:hypothetical protein VTK26DRAFT_8249 [Humicola hyalothermophila]
MSTQEWDHSAPDKANHPHIEPVKALGTSVIHAAPTANSENLEVKKPGIPAGWVKQTPYDYNAINDWDCNAKVYEFVGEEGDIGPEHPALEMELFGEPSNRVKQGVDFTKIASIELYQEGPVRVQPIAKFEDAGLHPAMLQNVHLAGYKLPTPIQRYCLPAIHMGYDVIGIAQTGSGKTAAFLIPILNKLMGKAKKLAAPRPNPATYRPGIDPPIRAEPLVVIICPSRELAVQVFNEARKFAYRTMLRPCVVYGGGARKDQVMQLQKGCDILVATPGRLVDFMGRPDVLSLKRVRYMVIDEADEMLQDDWKDDLDKILSASEQEVRFMLLSATFPKAARDLAKTHLAENHVRFRVGRAGSSHECIKQDVKLVEPALKKETLLNLLTTLPPTRTIIFVNTKRECEEVDDYLFNAGLPCASMHSDRTQMEREAAIRAFKSGTSPILITTAVSARGIDVNNLMHVINYSLPSIEHGGIEEYTHRIGRTGRIGHRGLATSFYCEKDEALASALVRTLMETHQQVPEFLEQYIPPGMTADNLKFEADSDFEEEAVAPAGHDGWGAEGDSWGNNNTGNTGGDAPGAAAGDGWGAEISESAGADTSAGW